MYFHRLWGIQICLPSQYAPWKDPVTFVQNKYLRVHYILSDYYRIRIVWPIVIDSGLSKVITNHMFPILARQDLPHGTPLHLPRWCLVSWATFGKFGWVLPCIQGYAGGNVPLWRWLCCQNLSVTFALVISIPICGNIICLRHQYGYWGPISLERKSNYWLYISMRRFLISLWQIHANSTLCAILSTHAYFICSIHIGCNFYS